MIGELLGEDIGEVRSVRVLPAGPQGPRIETTIEATGTLLGLHTTSLITYTTFARPDGTLHGEGQGLITTEKGDVVTFTGNGVGRMLGRGQAVSFRGAVYNQTAAPALARLNATCAIFEFEVDEGGKTHSKAYEWK